MPCAVDYILEGLANNLELERELGSFAVEFDRDFLKRLPTEREERAEPAKPAAPVSEPAAPSYDFVFLHHAPFGKLAAEMMAKVIPAIGKTPETAPVVWEGERPSAKIYVVLGPKALSQWYEGVSLTKGGWFRDVDSEVFFTHSPEEIFRYGPNLTPTMQQMKRDMWSGLQEGMRKVNGGK